MKQIIGLFTIIVAIATAQKQYVQIYYESLCPDSQEFVTNQLYPVMLQQGLKDYVQIDWIPFGKATMETRGLNTTFTCRHGPDECFGNKVQACAIQHIEGNSYEPSAPKETKVLEYIKCLMSMGKNFADNIYPGQKCAQMNSIQQWSIIEQCANSLEGSNLLKNFGTKTASLRPALDSVPYITFGGRSDPEISKRAVSNFGKTLCEQFSDPKPRVCMQYNSSAMTHVTALHVQIYYESLCPDSQEFVTNQLYPVMLQQGLKDYVQIDWIPFGKATMETRGLNTTFTCRHGPDECYGNKVQACAIQHIEGNSYEPSAPKETRVLEYIKCLMSMGKNFTDNIYPGQKCAQMNSIQQWSIIEQCANNLEGSNLLKNFGIKTASLRPPLDSVPYVTFGERNDPKISKRAVADFGKTLCEQFSDPKPRICV